MSNKVDSLMRGIFLVLHGGLIGANLTGAYLNQMHAPLWFVGICVAWSVLWIAILLTKSPQTSSAGQ